MADNVITTKDVARRAGVSTATAARVLGNYGSVKQQTKDKVLQAARELNYTPNALARSLVKLETKTIGLIIPDVCNTFFSTLARSVEKAAKKAGYRSFLCDTDADLPTENAYLQDFFERRVDGIIMASSIPFGKQHEFLGRAPVPIVMVDRTVSSYKGDCVRTDHVDGAYQAVKHLIALGHRRIGIVLGTGLESPHQERLDGYKRALAEAKIPFDAMLVKKRDWEQGLAVVDEYLQMDPQPTAIFATNNVVTIGILGDLKRLSLRVPEDLAVVAFDDLDTGFLLESPLTAIVQNPALIGGTAVELLLQRMHEGGTYMSPQEIIFRPGLTVRSSCGSNLLSQVKRGVR